MARDPNAGDGRGDGPGATRRRLLTTGAGLAGAASGLLGAGRARADAGANLPPDVPQWQKQQGAGILSPPYGVPSPHEAKVVRRLRAVGKPPATRVAAFSVTPLQDLAGIITPNGLHYERHHAGVPAIDPDQHRLLVHGLVERPLIFSMAELTRFPSVSRLHFLECSGNSPFAGEKLPGLTVQDTHGLLSCCEWTGVALSTVLAEAGVKPQAKWLLAEGADAAAMARSIPIEKALDDAILAYAQNGERLRTEQGYPLRLLLPGWEGNTSVKWLRRLKLGTMPFETRDETAKYTMIMPDDTIRQFNFVMEAKSVITSPSGGQQLRERGFYEISGLAWSGSGSIRRVEVTTDGGATWREAALQEPVLPKCLTRFHLPWHWDGGPAQLASRATDTTGYVQPSRAALAKIRDARSYYHNNAIQTWALAPDGRVTNAG